MGLEAHTIFELNVYSGEFGNPEKIAKDIDLRPKQSTLDKLYKA